MKTRLSAPLQPLLSRPPRHDLPPDSAPRTRGGAATATIPDEDAPASPLRPKLLTAAEVAALFRRSERALRDWVRRGHLVPVHIGRAVFFREEEVRALLGGRMRQGLLQARRERSSGAGTAPAGSVAVGASCLARILK